MTFAEQPISEPISELPGRTPGWRYRAPDHPHIVPVRAFNDNYIWLICLAALSGERMAVVVDPGDAAPVLRALQAAQLPLGGVLITHHHADHTGGIAGLKAAFPHAVVYGPRKCSNAFIERRFDHGDTLDLDLFGIGCRVIEVPGHTLDHNAYYFEQLGGDSRPVLFCGDTLFAGGCGRLFEGTPELMMQSLARLAALPTQTLVYCAHEYTLANLRFARAAEPANMAVAARLQEAQAIREDDIETVPSSIGVELQTNPFLRAREATVLQTLGEREAVDVHDPIAAFAALRQWKNGFSG